MEFIGSALSILAGIALIVLGTRDRTRSGRQMILLGIIVLLSSLMMGWSDFIEGWKDGVSD